MYDHYIALDWAQNNMAVARMTAKSDQIKTFEGPSDLKGLREFLSGLAGRKILTFEESTGSQWLYTELNDSVDKLVVCDPYRNRLLVEGPKTDKIDARKTVQLLRGGLLKEVFHSGDEFIYLRKIVSGYEDLVQSGVRLKNQRSALFRGVGANHKKDELIPSHAADHFVLRRLDTNIAGYQAQKKEYEDEFKRLCKKHKKIAVLKSIPGIGTIHAVQIAAIVVDINRFKSKGHFLSYCGLVKHEKMSGGRSYGKKNTRCSPRLKQAFKLAAFSVLQEGCNNPLRDLYQYLIDKKNLAPYVARNAVARRIAILSFVILSSGKKFDPHMRGKNKINNT